MLRKVISLSRSFFFIQIIIVIFSFLEVAITLLLPKFLLQLIRENSRREIFALLLWVLIFTLVSSITYYILTPLSEVKLTQLNVKILDEVLHKGISFNLSYFDKSGTYDKYTLIFEKCCAIFQTAITNLTDLLSALLQVVLVVSILSWMNPLILVVLFLFALLQSIIANRIKRENYAFQKKMANYNRRLNYLYRLFHIPEFMRDIRVNEIKDFIFDKKQLTTASIISDTFKVKKKVSAKFAILRGLSGIETFAVMAYLSVEVMAGRIWYDSFIVAFNSFNQLKAAVEKILAVYNSAYENDLYIKDYMSYMESEDTEQSGCLEIHANEIFSVEFRNVSFKYPNTSKKALDNITFSLKKGERIAIIGENGAGKTTIIKLLLRLYSPDKGMIMLNQIPIDQYEIASLRKAISVLFQDYSLYAFSLRDNLTLGQMHTDEEIFSALEKVGMLTRIQALPLGLETPISNQLLDNGVEFSGGERQRIALARMYLRGQSLIVLDEPTSNLDPFIESKFYEMLLNNTNNTMIIISHRITFGYRMTKIICIAKGKIIEEGTHDELVQLSDGFYKKMYKLNTAKYIRPEDNLLQ